MFFLLNSCRDSYLILVQFYSRHVQSDAALPPPAAPLKTRQHSAIKLFHFQPLVSNFSRTDTFIRRCVLFVSPRQALRNNSTSHTCEVEREQERRIQL